MAQNTDILLPDLAYTRADYAALRAFCQRLPVERIAGLYYSEDSPQVEIGLERFLIGMRDALVERAIENNPLLAESLTHARKTGHVPPQILSILVEAVDQKRALPCSPDPISKWFRPRTAQALRDESLRTLQDLVVLVNRRGASWWRSIPRIGEKRAAVIVRWLQQHHDQLGPVVPAPAHTLPSPTYELLDPAQRPGYFPALGSFYLPQNLDGRAGINRSPKFCFISAQDDLAAVECYLARFDGQPHTLRAYRKELERFVLWSVCVAGKPLSSLLVDDCEAYKRFLAKPDPTFCGPAARRGTALWRPFAEKAMKPDSQKYAITVIRGAFEWLFKVRYLAGNPWAAVKDPLVDQEVEEIQVGRALTPEGWAAVVDTLARLGEVQENAQDRVALAAMLLMGDSGLRRFEAAGARRAGLSPSRHSPGIWMLEFLGKRRKKRIVPVSPMTIEAIKAHWNDLGWDFDECDVDRPLLAPVVVPSTPSALAKHRSHREAARGYCPDSINSLVSKALSRVHAHMLALDGDKGRQVVTIQEIEELKKKSPHAFRHTFGSLAVENGMPLDVVQEIMGHEDSATTSIYVKAREKRIAVEAGKLARVNRDNKEQLDS